MEAVTIFGIFSRFTESILATQMRNVVLFGECGVGKSSIINAIVGQPVAKDRKSVV